MTSKKEFKIVDVIPNYIYELEDFFKSKKDIENGWKNLVRKAKFKTPFRKFFVTLDKSTFEYFKQDEEITTQHNVSENDYDKLINQIIKFIDNKYKDLGFDYKSLSKEVINSAFIEGIYEGRKMYFEIVSIPKYLDEHYLPGNKGI
ncbi:MAG: hypothetical protein ACFFKA_18860 [Candidatus Thorarchaeota archaeon]